MHHTAEYFSRETAERRLVGWPETIHSEMNKCLSLVHLTTTVEPPFKLFRPLEDANRRRPKSRLLLRWLVARGRLIQLLLQLQQLAQLLNIG